MGRWNVPMPDWDGIAIYCCVRSLRARDIGVSVTLRLPLFSKMIRESFSVRIFVVFKCLVALTVHRSKPSLLNGYLLGLAALTLRRSGLVEKAVQLSNIL